MQILDTLLIVAFAALIHASFQLSISVLTLLSSHTIGAKKSHGRLVRLTSAYIVGVATMTLLVMSSIALIATRAIQPSANLVVWVVTCGLLLGLGIAVWLFYYRREQGTTLWLPRPFARYLSVRTKATKQSAEAFGLGISSVVAELLFIFAPLLVATLLLLRLEPIWQLVGIGLYTTISLSSLGIIYALIGSGHRISHIQRWREENKRFLQFAGGGGLIVLGFYVYVDQVLSPTVLAAAGAILR